MGATSALVTLCVCSIFTNIDFKVLQALCRFRVSIMLVARVKVCNDKNGVLEEARLKVYFDCYLVVSRCIARSSKRIAAPIGRFASIKVYDRFIITTRGPTRQVLHLIVQ